MPDANQDVWYFAYGSNLSIDRMKSRTGPIRDAKRARLSRYQLVFNKRAEGVGAYANIVPNSDTKVWGVTYLCDQEAIEKLDLCEGVDGGHYVHEWLPLTWDDGATLNALAYNAGEEYICEGEEPTPEYVAHIIKGAEEHGLPEEYTRSILSEAFPNEFASIGSTDELASILLERISTQRETKEDTSAKHETKTRKRSEPSRMDRS